MSWLGVAVVGTTATASAAYKIAHGAHQKNLARKMKVERPTMTRSAASLEQENMARNMAIANRMPGQSLAENNINQQTARSTNNLLQTGASTNDIISGLGAVDQNARNSQNDLAGMAAQYNQHNKELFSNILGGVSNDQKELFDYNQNQPYQTAYLRKQALLNAGERNINNGFDQIADSGSQFGSMYSGGGFGTSSSGPRYDKNGNYIAAGTSR